MNWNYPWFHLFLVYNNACCSSPYPTLESRALTIHLISWISRNGLVDSYFSFLNLLILMQTPHRTQKNFLIFKKIVGGSKVDDSSDCPNCYCKEEKKLELYQKAQNRSLNLKETCLSVVSSFSEKLMGIWRRGQKTISFQLFQRGRTRVIEWGTRRRDGGQ